MYRDLATIIVSIGLVLYGIYGVIKVVRIFNEYIKKRKEYLTIGKDKSEYVQDYKKWMIIYFAISILCVYVAYDAFTKDNYLYVCAYIFIALFAITFALDAYMKRQCYFDEKDFFFDGKIIKYRSVSNVTPHKGLMPVYDIYINGEEELRMPRKIGDVLKEKQKEYKNRKKKD